MEQNNFEKISQYKDLSSEVEEKIRNLGLVDLMGLDESKVKAKEQESKDLADELNKKIEASDLSADEKDRLKKVVYYRKY